MAKVAKKTVKSSFFERVAQAHEEHKGDETRVGSGGDLPAGIEHGVARLVDAKIGVYAKGGNEGEPFFMAAGTVLDPESITVVDPKTKKARVIHVQGLRTQIGPEPLCDTTAQNGNETSLADHWDRVLNHLRLLGIDTKTIDPEAIITEGEDGKYTSGPVLEALVEAAPTFKFRTWQGKATAQYPNPRVNHDWRGICNYDDTKEDDVQDDTEAPEWESEKGEPEESEEPVIEEDTTPEPEEVDYEALGKLADSGKPKRDADAAAKELSERAAVLGIEGYEEMSTWKEVAEAIIAAESSEEESEEEESDEEPEEEWSPTEGEIAYMSNGPKKKPTECEVVKIYAKLKKADVTRLDTKKLVKGVPLDKLSGDDKPF